jgi:acyl carrier protein
MAVFDDLKEIIADKLSVEPADIKMESHFIDDLGADSLDLADLVMVVEDKYEVDFSNEDTDQFETVGSVVKAIENLKNS